MRNEREYIELAIRTDYLDDYALDYEIDHSLQKWFTRWGKCDIQTLQQIAAQTRDNKERRVALLAIGFAQHPESCAILQPYLQSTHPEEQLASAIGLWDTHRELSFSILDLLFQTNIFALDHFDSFDLYWLFSKYHTVLYLFSEWKDSRVIVTIRHALIAVAEMENQFMLHEHISRRSGYDKEVLTDLLYHFQLNCALMLGKFDAFGSLTGIEMNGDRIKKLMLLIVCGSIMRGSETNILDTVHELKVGESSSTREAFQLILEQQFGLNDAECQLCIRDFCSDPL